MRFHVTTHFASRLAERGISIEDAKETVLHPDNVEYQRSGTHGGKVRLFRRLQSRVLAVVAETKNDEAWLATAYYED